MPKILITGTAGFIGFHLALKLLELGYEVIGVDSINDYYQVDLKYSRLEVSGISRNDIQYGIPVQSTKFKGYRFIQMKLEDREYLTALFKQEKFEIVFNLAGQAGVRYSIENPFSYIDSNITGFLNILEGCRQTKVAHLIYASSSSVYGLNKSVPFSVHDSVDHPVSLYAATKKSNELMAHSYSHLFGLQTTGLRFFTVYGPWGRPDMALYMFTKAILEGKPIDVFNNGNLKRDFTFIDDIIEGLLHILDKYFSDSKQMQNENSKSYPRATPYKLFNIGNGQPVSLLDFIKVIEEIVGKKAELNMLPMQPGDVTTTWADLDDFSIEFGYKPFTPIKAGVTRFVEWYRSYYSI